MHRYNGFEAWREGHHAPPQEAQVARRLRAARPWKDKAPFKPQTRGGRPWIERALDERTIAPGPGWDPRFRVGDAVRTVGGGGSYAYGEIVAIAEEEPYYRVAYGPGFATLIREENLEPFGAGASWSKPPRSFVPPVLPFM